MFKKTKKFLEDHPYEIMFGCAFVATGMNLLLMSKVKALKADNKILSDFTLAVIDGVKQGATFVIDEATDTIHINPPEVVEAITETATKAKSKAA